MQTDMPVNSDTTVNGTIARCPEAIAVLNRFGIDTCCGGGMSISDAARAQGLDPSILLEAIRQTAAR